MHSPDKIQLFLDLRSKGNCLTYISTAIDVPVSTLGDWNCRYVVQIDAARAAKWESAEQSLQFNPEADLLRITQRIRACEQELDRRPIARMSVGELVRVISLWRREYFRRRNLLLAPIERPSRPVTPEVTRGLTSPDASEHPATLPADAAPDLGQQIADPEPESKPEKTGIPDSPDEVGQSNNTPLSFDIHSSFGHPASPPAPPPLFSLDNLVPPPTCGWLPSDNVIYRADRPLNRSNSKKQSLHPPLECIKNTKILIQISDGR